MNSLSRGIEGQPGVFRTCLEFLDLEELDVLWLVFQEQGGNLGSSPRTTLAITGTPKSLKPQITLPFPQTAAPVPAFDALKSSLDPHFFP